MTSTTILLILSTTLLILAVVVAVVPVDDATVDAAPPVIARLDSAHAIRAAWAGGFGIVVLAVSGWVIPAIVIAAATWYWVAAFQRRDSGRADDVERTDALASWIENLRDVLLAGDQPIGAIASTVPSAPPVIRPAVRTRRPNRRRADIARRAGANRGRPAAHRGRGTGADPA